MTSESARELDQIAFNLCYWGIRFSGLSREPSVDDDALAEKLKVSVLARLNELINDEFTRLEALSNEDVSGDC